MVNDNQEPGVQPLGLEFFDTETYTGEGERYAQWEKNFAFRMELQLSR